MCEFKYLLGIIAAGSSPTANLESSDTGLIHLREKERKINTGLYHKLYLRLAITAC